MAEQGSMEKAYQIAQEMISDRLKQEDPEAYREIQDVKDADVIITRGEYDHIERVLSLSGTPFTLINTSDLDTAALRPDQIIFVNCPGKVRPAGLRKLSTFVAEGGFLFTTDWALKHVLELAFPGYVEYNEKPTSDEVVRVEMIDTEDPFLRSIIGPGDDPQWWLEGSSYPIRILDKEKVKVLVTSKEIEAQYGESPVFITFDHKEGKVYHMISHFYLQRSETRTARHSASADAYLAEKEIPDALKEKYAKMDISESNLGEVESAYTSHAMMQKVMYDKRRQLRRRKQT